MKNQYRGGGGGVSRGGAWKERGVGIWGGGGDTPMHTMEESHTTLQTTGLSLIL